MMWNYARFDFGKSYFRDVSVMLDLIGEKLPVSIARHLDDAVELSDLNSARHPQGGKGSARGSTCDIDVIIVRNFIAILLNILFPAVRSGHTFRCAG